MVTGKGLPNEILDRLRCVRCGEKVTAAEDSVSCPNGHRMSFNHGYLDALGNAQDSRLTSTFDGFGYEWTTFHKIQPEDESFWRRYFANVPLEELKDGVGLDAGCGKGRYTRFTAPYLGATVALDGSDSVKAAAQNLADIPMIAVVKADLLTAPFAGESFDFISCLGVLHHLPSPEEGFEALVKLLAPKGLLLVYVYSRSAARDIRSVGLRAAAWMRRLSVRLPHPLVKAASALIAGCLYLSLVVPGTLGDRFRVRVLSGLPLHTYRRKPVRSLWLDTFDRLTAPMEHRYLWTDLEPWFHKAGLIVEAVREDAGLYIVARKSGLKSDPAANFLPAKSKGASFN